MHPEYRVKFPDQDFLIGEKHKLIPSNYAVCEKKTKAVLLATTSRHIQLFKVGNVTKGAAASYIKEFWALLSLDKFKEVCLKDGILNSMLFVSIDSGPDNAPGRN